MHNSSSGVDNIDTTLYKNGHPHNSKDGFSSNDLPKILSLPVDRGGCGWYRVRQYLRYMEHNGLANVHIFDGKETNEQMEQSIEVADVILARNGTDQMVQLIKERWPHKKIVFDHDDNTFGILPSNQHYKDHGVEDIFVTTDDGESKPLWVTGITDGFNKHANLRKQNDLIFNLRTADLVTSPTHHLSGYWANYNDHAAVTYNCILEEFLPKSLKVVDKKKGDEFRIGWQGGISHFADIETVAKPLKTFLSKHKNAVLYMVGSNYPVLFKGYEDRIRTLPWIDHPAHLLRMASLNLDVAFIPLQDAEFNDYKSEIKFTEFAALGVPSVVINRKPYVVEGRDICKDGENCLTYNTEKEFTEQIEKLYGDEKLRERLGKRAKTWAYDNRSMSKWAPIILEIWLTQ